MNHHIHSTSPNVRFTHRQFGQVCFSMRAAPGRDSRRLHSGNAGLAMRADRQTEAPINPLS
jgi:hypothetical protein